MTEEKEIDISNSDTVLVPKRDITPQLYELLRKILPLAGKAEAVSGQIKTQLFTSSGTWTKPINTKFAMIFAIGAGGGCEAGTGSQAYGAGGGGAITGIFSNLKGNLTITIGLGSLGADGGDTIITDGNKTYTANGGKRGNGSSYGLGGAPNNGDDFINYNGGRGGNVYIVGGFPRGGNGGGGAGCGANGGNATDVSAGYGNGGVGVFGESGSGTSGGRGGDGDLGSRTGQLYGGGAASNCNPYGGYAATTGANGMALIMWIE